jgi:hypothetical protein
MLTLFFLLGPGLQHEGAGSPVACIAGVRLGGLACGIKYDNGKREMEMGGVTREGIREIQAGCGALGWS